MPVKSEVERLKHGLVEINEHFDDQGFTHTRREPCGECTEALVNYAGAVLNGYEGTLADWQDERIAKRTAR